MKTSEIEYVDAEGDVLTLVAEWEDTSFAHEFGTQVQGQWNLVSVESSNGLNVISMLADDRLEMLQKYVDENLEYYY